MKNTATETTKTATVTPTVQTIVVEASIRNFDINVDGKGFDRVRLNLTKTDGEVVCYSFTAPTATYQWMKGLASKGLTAKFQLELDPKGFKILKSDLPAYENPLTMFAGLTGITF